MTPKRLCVQGHNLGPKLSPFLLALFHFLCHSGLEPLTGFDWHFGGVGFNEEFALCLSGTHKAVVTGGVESNWDEASQKTCECMKGMGRKPMTQQESPVTRLHLSLLVCLKAETLEQAHRWWWLSASVTECVHTVHMYMQQSGIAQMLHTTLLFF